MQSSSSQSDDKDSKKESRSKREKLDYAHLYKGPNGEDLPKDVINQLTLFTRKQKSGTIDVWWLYDDGGKLIKNYLSL